MNTPIKQRYSLALLAVGLLLLGAACGKKDATNTNSTAEVNTNSSVNDSDDGNTNSEDTNTNSDDTDATNSNTNSSDDDSNTNSSSDDTPTASGTLIVTKPEKNEEVESPAEIEGKSAASLVYVRFTNGSGKEIFTVEVTVRNGVFHLEPDFQFTNTTSGFIEFYEKNANDEEVNLVKIPVTFKVEAADEIEAEETNANTNSDDTNE